MVEQNKHRYEVFFNIEERGRHKVLIDNYGYLCGVYRTYRDAKEAIPNVRRKIIRMFKEKEQLAAQSS